MTSYVITGAGRGMGLEWIKQLSNASPSNLVFAVVRNPSSSPALEALESGNANVHIITGDVSSPSSMVAAAAAVRDITGGKLDVLVHNAVAYPSDGAIMGVGPGQLSPADEEMVARTKAAFEVMWDTAVYGTIWTTNAFLPLLEKAAAEKGVAKVANISTGLADVEFTLKSEIEYAVPYAVAKAAMNVVTAKYAVELRAKGVKFVAMSPGYVETFPGESKFALFHI